jgi:CheY-like chemotaxis protein/anti-sigma regulatory factor (Ser/Thr protein kinase)
LLGINASANHTRLEYKSKNLDSVMVTSDVTKLRQIVINLASNAIKFTHEGTVTVTASLKKVAGPSVEENRLVISVKDTGIGIEPDRLEHIFDKFTQSDSSISRRYGGTGLGLSIAKELSQILGGDVKVASRVGEGSCFTMSAMVSARTIDSASLQEAQSNLDKNTILKPGISVLLAEDNAINAVVAQALLEQLGCTVTHVDNGLKAAVKVEEETFDVIFMDIHMPVMDGVEATRRIRSLPSDVSQIPIIGLTAEAFKERHDAFKQDGMNDVVTKPITIEALKGSLLKLAL